MPTYRASRDPVEATREQADQALDDGYGVAHSIEVVTINPKRATRDSADASVAPRDEAREVFTLYDLHTGKPVAVKE